MLDSDLKIKKAENEIFISMQQKTSFSSTLCSDMSERDKEMKKIEIVIKEDEMQRE